MFDTRWGINVCRLLGCHVCWLLGGEVMTAVESCLLAARWKSHVCCGIMSAGCWVEESCLLAACPSLLSSWLRAHERRAEDSRLMAPTEGCDNRDMALAGCDRSLMAPKQ